MLINYLSTGTYANPPQTSTMSKPWTYSIASPWGWYSADQYLKNNRILVDLTGNGNDAWTSGITQGSAVGNGAIAKVYYLSGNPSSQIIWPNGTIPKQWTACGVQR